MKRRQLGQHQLADAQLLQKVVETAGITPTDRVVEIGAGYGNLTTLLCERAKLVYAYEVDPELCAAARAGLGQRANLKLVCGDGLRHSTRFDILVSNLPYSISRRFIEWLAVRTFKWAVVMLQREFVAKLLATRGSRNYRALSVIAQVRFDIEVLVPVIPPRAFSPRPRVSSALLRLTPRRMQTIRPATLLALKLLFAHRGKRVGAALRPLMRDRTNRFDASALDDQLLTRRVESLSPNEALGLAERCAIHGVTR